MDHRRTALCRLTLADTGSDNMKCIQCAAKKSNPLPCFANSLATAYNFFMKLRSDIACSITYNF